MLTMHATLASCEGAACDQLLTSAPGCPAPGWSGASREHRPALSLLRVLSRKATDLAPVSNLRPPHLTSLSLWRTDAETCAELPAAIPKGREPQEAPEELTQHQQPVTVAKSGRTMRSVPPKEWVEERRLVAQTAVYSGTKFEGLYLGSYEGNAPSHHWFLAKTEQGEEVMSSNAFEKHAGCSHRRNPPLNIVVDGRRLRDIMQEQAPPSAEPKRRGRPRKVPPLETVKDDITEGQDVPLPLSSAPDEAGPSGMEALAQAVQQQQAADDAAAAQQAVIKRPTAAERKATAEFRDWVELQRPAALDAEYAKTGVKGHFLGVWGKKPYFLVHTDTGEEAMTANDFERHAGCAKRRKPSTNIMIGGRKLKDVIERAEGKQQVPLQEPPLTDFKAARVVPGIMAAAPDQAAVVGKGKHGGHRRPPSASRLNPAPASVAEGASPSAAVAAKRRSSKAAAAAPTPKRQRRAEEAGAVAETTEAAAASPEAAAPAPKAAKAAKQRAGPKGSSLERGAYGEAARFLKELQKGGMAAVVPQWDKMDAACSGFDEQAQIHYEGRARAEAARVHVHRLALEFETGRISHEELIEAVAASKKAAEDVPEAPAEPDVVKLQRRIVDKMFGTAQWKTMPANYFDAERQKWWWTRSDAVDKEMTEKFGEDLKKAAAGGLADWQAGFNALAAVILMDQMSRNIYRNSAKMYALDAQALELAKRLLNRGAAQQFVPFQRMWLLLPLMHSEKLEDQETVVQMATQLKEECEQMPDAEPLVKSFDNAADFGRKHRQALVVPPAMCTARLLGMLLACRDVIKQWGRFPHRNVILSRDSTPAEEEGLRNKTIPSF
eukprot:jgi/Astpho2/4126/Aster-01269